MADWWKRALTLRERCELSSDLWNTDQTDQYWDRWLNSVGFRGNESFLEQRMSRLGNIDTVQRAMGIDIESAEIDIPAWAERLEDMFFVHQWPTESAIVELLKPNTKMPDEETYKYLGILVVAAPILEEAARRLNEGIRHILEQTSHESNDSSTVGKWLAMVWPTVLARVQTALMRTMVLELNVDRVKGLLDDSSPEEGHRSFVQRLLDGPRSQQIVVEYPVLFRHILHTTDSAVEVLLELFQRLVHDRPLLEEQLGIRHDADVIGISLDAGDTHRGGRSVAILHFEDGSAVAYKPRPMAVDLAFHKATDWLSNALQSSGDIDLRVPHSIDCGEYGWAQFIQSAPCEDDQGVARFYRRHGAMLSLLYVLRGSDFHFENCIAAGEYPMLIDLETILGQFQEPERPSNIPEADFLAQQALAQSVIHIGLLPIPLWGTEDRPGVDFSGLGGEQGQVIPQPRGQLKDEGTDQARIETVESTELGTQLNRPRIGDSQETIHIEAYVDEVVAGFIAGYSIMAQQRDSLQDLIRSFRSVQVRHIIRHTATYGKIAIESSHPDLCRDALARDCFLDSLWAAARHDPALTELIPAELEDLSSGDIPVFYIRPSSRDLESSSGERIRNFFSMKGEDGISVRLGALGPKDLDFQSWVIRASVASLGKSVKPGDDWRKPGDRLSAHRSLEGRVVAAVGDFADQLVEEAYGAGDKCWVTMAPSVGDHWSIQPTTDSLYSGKAGIALFLHTAGQHLERHDLIERAREIMGSMVQRFEQYLDDGEQQAAGLYSRLGPYDGVGGLIYAGHLIGNLSIAEATQLAERSLRDSRLHQGPVLDTMSGLTGMLLLLEELGTAREGLSVDSILPSDVHAKFCSALSHDLELPGQVAPGFAHGISGILSSPSLTSWCEQHIDGFSREELLGTLIEGSGAHQSSVPSWCRGGIGMLAGMLRRFALSGTQDPGEFGDQFEKVLKGIEVGRVDDDSLCHGTAGLLHVLNIADRLGIQTRTGTRIREESLNHLLTRAEAHSTRSAAPHGIRTPGLMDGTSGSMLALLGVRSESTVPSVLTLSW